MEKTYTGKCLCGAVSYVATGAPVVVAQCHCEECRRLSGTGHSVGAMFLKVAVNFAGKLSEFKYLSAKGSKVTKAFCPACGSPVYGTNTSAPDHLTLTLGTIDNASDLAVAVVVFAAEKQHWDGLDADAMSFGRQPDWTPPDA